MKGRISKISLFSIGMMVFTAIVLFSIGLSADVATQEQPKKAVSKPAVEKKEQPELTGIGVKQFPGLTERGKHKLLRTCNWHQVEPFNAYAPLVNCKRTVAGSAAVAMGIVMNYHKCPKSAKMMIEHAERIYNVGDGRAVALVEKYDPEEDVATVFQWEGMVPCDLHIGFAGRLLRYIGDKLDMRYLPHGSESVIPFVSDRDETNCAENNRNSNNRNKFEALFISDEFKYNDNIKTICRDNRNKQKWFRKIKDEIDAGRPCILLLKKKDEQGVNSIYKKKKGYDTRDHFVVIDGYFTHCKCNMIHLNWGSGGAHDDYYDPDKIRFVFDDEPKYYEIPTGPSTIIGIQPNE